MNASVTIVGAGDAGLKIAAGLVQSGRLRRLVLAGLSQGRGPAAAGLLASLGECPVAFVELDGTRQADVEALLRRERPDLLVQSASLLSPWLTVGRQDPVARALAAAGLGVQLPAQLPVLATVMQAARAVDFAGPVANLSLPDLTHPVLHGRGLAPTIGLGNVSMQLLRVRSALKARIAQKTVGGAAESGAGEALPLIRVVGHHKQVYGVMTAAPPADPDLRVRVYLGEAGERADELAYLGYPLAPGIDYNVVTAASAVPVLLALLPGAQPLRFSAPAPHGLPGGYPVRIAAGEVALDLPPGAELEEIVAFHRRIGRGDGVERIDPDGTVTFTEAARGALAAIDPALTEPLAPADVTARYQRLARHLSH
jgi:hypothetical protein